MPAQALALETGRWQLWRPFSRPSFGFSRPRYRNGELEYAKITEYRSRQMYWLFAV